MTKTLRPAEKPWVICKLGASEKSRVVGRYANRSDAETALRFIQMKTHVGGHFVVAFDVVEDNDHSEQPPSVN
jgi:hypothetical protein